jgi:hypothetical protein
MSKKHKQLTGNKAITEIKAIEVKSQRIDALYDQLWDIQFSNDKDVAEDLDQELASGSITSIDKLREFFSDHRDRLTAQAIQLVPYTYR